MSARRKYTLLRRWLAAFALAASIAIGVPACEAQAQPTPFKTFPTAEAAVDALVDAIRHDDEQALLAMLGTGWTVFVPNLKEDVDAHRERFLGAWDQGHKIVPVSDGKVVVEVGTTGFTMPTPIVKDIGGWRFDVLAGAREIQARRIGHNELTVVQTLLAIVDAECEYALLDPMNTGVRTYARRLMSSPGRRDGLYWPVREGEPKSPLGSLVAKAEMNDSSRPIAFFGYHFRIMTGQGASAPGGAYSYLARDQMIGGFAAIAWPVRYGDTGVMAFMVSLAGEVYEKDLGPQTLDAERTIVIFDPGNGWQKADMKP